MTPGTAGAPVYYTYKNASAERWTVALYDPEQRTERPLATFDQPLPRWSGTLSVSPDERWMLLPTHKGSAGLQREGFYIHHAKARITT